MSEEDSEGKSEAWIHPIFGPVGSPDEVQKLMDRQQMLGTAFSTHVTNCFQEMSPEAIAMLRSIFSSIRATEDISIAAYWEGNLAAMLRFVYKVCPGCGAIHKGEGLEFLVNKETPKPECDQ